MGERQGQPLPLERPSWFLNAALSVFIFWLLFHFHPTLLFLVCIIHRLQDKQVGKDCPPPPPCLLRLVWMDLLGRNSRFRVVGSQEGKGRWRTWLGQGFLWYDLTTWPLWQPLIALEPSSPKRRSRKVFWMVTGLSQTQRISQLPVWLYMLCLQTKQTMFRHRPFSDLKWISCSKHALIPAQVIMGGGGDPTVSEMWLLGCSIPWGPAPFTLSAQVLFLWLIEPPEEIWKYGRDLKTYMDWAKFPCGWTCPAGRLESWLTRKIDLGSEDSGKEKPGLSRVVLWPKGQILASLPCSSPLSPPSQVRKQLLQ